MQHNLMSAFVVRLLILISMLMLSACVTEMEGRRVSSVDEEKRWSCISNWPPVMCKRKTVNRLAII